MEQKRSRKSPRPGKRRGQTLAESDAKFQKLAGDPDKMRIAKYVDGSVKDLVKRMQKQHLSFEEVALELRWGGVEFKELGNILSGWKYILLLDFEESYWKTLLENWQKILDRTRS
jgi:hypothetical protein